MRYSVLVLCLLAAGPAAAQRGLLGLYVGAGLGSFQFDENQRGQLPSISVLGSDVPVGGLRIPVIDDSVTTWKVFGGWQMSPNLGVEVSYGQTQDLETSYSAMVGDLTVATNLATDVSVGAARAMGYLPLRLVTLYGGLGYFEADFSASGEIDLVISGAANARDTVQLGGVAGSDSGATALIGVQWSLFSLSFRADYEWLDMEAASASTLGVGVALRF